MKSVEDCIKKNRAPTSLERYVQSRKNQETTNIFKTKGRAKNIQEWQENHCTNNTRMGIISKETVMLCRWEIDKKELGLLTAGKVPMLETSAHDLFLNFLPVENFK